MRPQSRPRYLPPLLFAMLLAACARSTAPPLHPDVSVHVKVEGDADVHARESCASGVTAALRRHGFVPDLGGALVDVEAVLMREAGQPLPSTGPENIRWQAATAAPESTTTVELIARVQIDGRASKVLRAASTAPSDACAFAADRLADSLREAVDAPR